MVKIADSAAIRQNMATGPRSGTVQVDSEAVIKRALLFVLPIRIVRMLEVPQRATAVNGWDRREIVDRRRRTCGPFQSPRVPWIISRNLAPKVGPQQVVDEHQHT